MLKYTVPKVVAALQRWEKVRRRQAACGGVDCRAGKPCRRSSFKDSESGFVSRRHNRACWRAHLSLS